MLKPDKKKKKVVRKKPISKYTSWRFWMLSVLIVMWVISYMTTSYAITDRYIAIGVLFGWVAGLYMMADILNWGNPDEN